MTEFILTTVLRYADRAEGQVLHRGTKESCDEIQAMLPAIMTSGEAPESASMLVVEATEFDLPAGQAWVARKPQ